MLIQPLVENAVMHGIEPKVDGGEIVVRAACAAACCASKSATTAWDWARARRGPAAASACRICASGCAACTARRLSYNYWKINPRA
jgi:hypothetical protein